MKIKCAAIDDEPLALRQIGSYINRLDFLELTDSWSDSRRALEALRSRDEAMLLFVDIDMPDISGIELTHSLEDKHYIIFTTAYSQYAIDGFRLNAVDYLLKPISFAEFERAANKVINLHRLKQASEEASAPSSTSEEAAGYISVKADYKVTPVKICDIIYAESVGEYVRLNLRDGSTVTTLYRLKNMESQLPSAQFARVHRSYIVNLGEVRNYTRVKITLGEELQLPIGDSYRDSLIAHLDNFYNRE